MRRFVPILFQLETNVFSALEFPTSSWQLSACFMGLWLDLVLFPSSIWREARLDAQVTFFAIRIHVITIISISEFFMNVMRPIFITLTISESDVTYNYVPSPCFSSARRQPEYLVSEGFPICSGFPVEGEPYGRLWVLRWASFFNIFIKTISPQLKYFYDSTLRKVWLMKLISRVSA